MKLIPMLSRLLAAAALLLPASAADLRIEGNRLTLSARNEPLRDVLAAFARQGVRVRLDPAVTGAVSLAVTRLDAEKTLGMLLKDNDYVALWKKAPGPLGPIPVLEELQVYRPGRRQAAALLAADPATGAATNRIRLREYIAGELLVRPAPGMTPERFLELVARHGGRVVGSLPSLGLYKLVFPPEADIPALAAALGGQDGILSAEPNYVYRLPPTAERQGPVGSGLRDGATPPVSGAPLIAVLDTGFGLSGDPLVGWLDAIGGSASPVDLHGHGTQMTLLAAGRVQPVSGSVAGDPLLPVLAIRIAGDGQFVAGDALLESLEAAVAGGARVISLSWGSDMDSAYLKEVLARAAQKGALVLAAAGNEATGKAVYPAAFPGVLAVGAVDASGRPAEWSNYGDFVDLAAPGLAPVPGQPLVSSGTSVSTAYAAHVLGLYFRKHPEATPEQAVRALREAVSAGVAGWDPRYGAGPLTPQAVERFLR